MIVNKNTMYVFCEVIKQLEPDRVLDAGMFIESIGGITRQILDMGVPEEYYMTGVRIKRTDNLNVYNNIYNDIIDINKISELMCITQENYISLVCFLVMISVV